MPAIMTHYQFGISTLAKRGAGSFPTRAERDAFLLGNQGPDPFFFVVRTPSFRDIGSFGRFLHNEHVDASIEAMIACAQSAKGIERLVLDAYISGYLCHFSLDSATHPYVISLTHALCAAGVPGLDERDDRYVHSQIESDIDAYMLWRHLGKTVADLSITRYALQGNNKLLGYVDGLFFPMISELYDLSLPGNLYTRGIHDMRMAYNIIQSPSGRKRVLIGMLERALPKRRHSFLQALSHRNDVYDDGAIINLEREPWMDIFTGEQRVESFIDLFDAASDAAVVRINAFLDGQADTHTLTGGKDFSGNLQW